MILSNNGRLTAHRRSPNGPSRKPKPCWMPMRNPNLPHDVNEALTRLHQTAGARNSGRRCPEPGVLILVHLKADRLPFDPGPAAWDAILSPGKAYPALEEKRTSDWLVIGAGFAGLSAARRLQQLHPKDTITLLEARRSC